MSARTYHSIGDVLTLLREEFPDITISKIRFLESQGLVSPQRSPSGYRKFYDEDIERLRYVLIQQREHFLPLKVIRDRLNGVVSEDDTGAGDPAPAQVAADPEPAAPKVAAKAPRPERPAEARTTVAASSLREPTVADVVAALQEVPVGRHAAAEAAPVEVVPTPAPTRAPEPVASPEPAATGSMTLEELAVETGLSEAELRSLVEFGILREGSIGGMACFDAQTVTVAGLAAGFLSQGVEARHLRLFRNAVDREMGLLEQLVTPLLRQRNPEARARAEATSTELVHLGGQLHAAMIDIELRDLLER
jgi:DNA-binding transcriptional MerR regulator